MPDTKTNEDDNDDVRARFAHLAEPAEEETETDDLPPVPQVSYGRPQTQTAREVRPGELTGRSGGGGIGLVGSSRDVKGSGIALSIGTNLVAAIIVGTGLGWLVDKYLLHSTTTPWGLIVGFLLGTVAGFVGLIRAANQLNKD